jgi:hypothetical protein
VFLEEEVKDVYALRLFYCNEVWFNLFKLLKPWQTEEGLPPAYVVKLVEENNLRLSEALEKLKYIYSGYLSRKNELKKE